MTRRTGGSTAAGSEYQRPFEFTADRIRWLIALRWVAMLGVAGATVFALAGFFPGVAWQALLFVALSGTAYNFVLWRNPTLTLRGPRAAVIQSLVDMLLLTIVLWAAGGIGSPFLGYYIFHVALIAVLGGPRAMSIALAAALAGVGFLGLTEVVPALQIGKWDPKPPWDTIADVVAYITTLAAAAYVVTHAVRELRQRERELHRAEQSLLMAERLASLGRVAQGVAHELNTPLATIRTLAADMREVLRELPQDEHVRDIGESAALIRDETARLGRITQSLLAGGQMPDVRISRVELLPIVERAGALVFAGAKDGLEFSLDRSLDPLFVNADPDGLVQVLVNLLQNARDSIREAGGRRIAVRGELKEGFVDLVVDDDGTGISADVEGRLFEPFATTKPPGEGTGLGLYASYMLVKTMGGELTLENRLPRGARATVSLPLERQVVAQAQDLPHRVQEV